MDFLLASGTLPFGFPSTRAGLPRSTPEMLAKLMAEHHRALQGSALASLDDTHM